MLIDQFHPQDPSSLIRSFAAVTSLRFVQESGDTMVMYMEIYDRVRQHSMIELAMRRRQYLGVKAP